MAELSAGEPAPHFIAPSPINPRFAFDSVGGRYILLTFLPAPGSQRDAMLSVVSQNRALFSDEKLVFFGVLPDTNSFEGVPLELPFRWICDPKGELRTKYGAVDSNGAVKPRWTAIDPSLRLLGFRPPEAGSELVRLLANLGNPDDHARVPLHAPVLIVPRIFESDLCRHLVELYDRVGGAPSGVMQSRNGLTVGVFNDMKKRRDMTIEDEALKTQIRLRIARRLIPEIAKAFQFTATRIERYIVAYYSAEEGGYFRRHRDNTSPGTAHRKFAVTINLNVEEYDGGDLRFPEFGSHLYRAPTGGAVVFSCSLLHEATPVTRGIRYACLPFLYDEAGAKIREDNIHTIVAPPSPAEPTGASLEARQLEPVVSNDSD
jgi:predicted 2-oxoglutarate/Fe(II)-dependent dioxygenase YbiX